MMELCAWYFYFKNCWSLYLPGIFDTCFDLYLKTFYTFGYKLRYIINVWINLNISIWPTSQNLYHRYYLYNCFYKFTFSNLLIISVHSKLHNCLFRFYSSRLFDYLHYMWGNTFRMIYFIFTTWDKNRIKFVVIITSRKTCMRIKQKIYKFTINM